MKIKETKKDLKGLKEYAIKYFEDLLVKYGKGRERKTKSSSLETIEARTVAFNNQKIIYESCRWIYWNRFKER